MYVIMFGNDENLYHEGPFMTWEEAKKTFEKRYEEQTASVEEEWLDMCNMGNATYTVYVNGEYVINAEIYSYEELFDFYPAESEPAEKVLDKVENSDPSSNGITGRFYLDGQAQKEGYLLCVPRIGENVMLGSELHEVQQVCYNADDPHVVDIFLG
mgnify:CR=1 FL=1